jgi:chaperonin cofactor prefoldin
MTLEEEIEMLEQAKASLKDQLNSVETRLQKLKA